MKVIFEAKSVNGRFGVAIVSATAAKMPARGSLVYLGKVAGMETFRLDEAPDETWVLAGRDTVRAHGGATIAYMRDLQGGESAYIAVGGPQAVVEHVGYKGRSSRVVAYVSGQPEEIPAPVLLAMGLLPMAEEAKVEAPAPLGGAMAAAFSKLRSPE